MKKTPKPSPQTVTPEFRVVIETPEKTRGLSFKEMVVAIVAIVVSGAVAAAGLYGVATHDYTPLKGIGESVSTVLARGMNALK
jgi:hypothetical protein